MKPYQKHRIGMMRGRGATYAAIAAELGVSESTVKSHCRRKGISTSYETCPECGKRLVQEPKRKKKRFCSNYCRMQWWAKNPEARNKNQGAVYNFICPHCNNPFTAYGNAKRKYCSRACSALARGTKESNM